MRILITGSNGVLGTQLLTQGQAKHDLLGTSIGVRLNGYVGQFDYEPLDITDPTAVTEIITEYYPDWVIHTAAYTAVDLAETQRELCEKINVDGTRHVAAACREANAGMVYLSTDYVFDGAQGPYAEDDPTHPLGWYAKTKYDGEGIVRSMVDDWLICRTTVLYGVVKFGRQTFVPWLIGALKRGEAVKIVTDQLSNPTLANDLANMIYHLIERGERGVFHTMGSDYLSRFDFSRQIARYFGLPTELVQPTTTDQLSQAAPRPLRGGGKIDKLQATGYEPLNVEAQLAQVARELEVG